MYKVSVNLPNLDKGALLELDGLGVVENGSEFVVDKEAADAFRTRNQVATMEYDSHGNRIVTYEDGPTVLQAFKNTVGIEVSTIKSENEEKSNSSKAENKEQPVEVAPKAAANNEEKK